MKHQFMLEEPTSRQNQKINNAIQKMNKNIKIQQIKLNQAEDLMDKRKKKKKQEHDKEEKDQAAKLLKSVGKNLKTEF